MNKTCPNCGAPLPEEASFCPACARSVGRRTRLRVPALRSRGWVMRLAAALVIAAALAAAGSAAAFFLLRPQVYDAMGEVIYTDRDGTYQLLLAWPEDRYQPVPTIAQQVEEGGEYRYPSRLYINSVESGENMSSLFLRKVESVTTEVLQPENGAFTMTSTPPEPDSYSPDAAMVTYLDFTGGEGVAQLVWTIRMDNGDEIILRQDQAITTVRTYDIYPEDAPMETTEELQALIDDLEGRVDFADVVNLYLPAVTYEGGLEIGAQSVNLYGGEEDGRRTTFTDTLVVREHSGPICYLYNIDFVGDRGSVGLSAAANTYLVGCSFTGWKTGVLAHGSAWVTTVECRYEDNETGFWFNCVGNSVNHSTFSGNTFRDNGTAMVLEQVPTDVTLSFPDSLFEGNGTDIDNRCGQALDLSMAEFR